MHGLQPADSAEAMAAAAAALRSGQLVVFPTETVYGLGAHALDEQAVRRIFAAKRRPADNPLIVHVPDVDAARKLAASWPAEAERLAAAFWPGPLTLVLPRTPHVPDATTGGLDSVALRVPSHPVAQRLLREAGVPLAAPSANRSGRPSPTRAEDAFADLGEDVALVLDAGPTTVGVESTVVSLLGPTPVLLRPGGVSRERLEAVVGPLAEAAADDARRSPGMRYRHYAPRARLRLASASRLADIVQEEHASGAKVAVVASTESGQHGPHVRVPGSRADGDAWARALFALLRDLDAAGYDAIVVEEILEKGVGAAVLNRLRKAAEP